MGVSCRLRTTVAHLLDSSGFTGVPTHCSPRERNSEGTWIPHTYVAVTQRHHGISMTVHPKATTPNQPTHGYLCTALSGQQPELLPTRGSHSALSIQSSLDTGALQYLPSTISLFNVSPDPRGPTTPCWRRHYRDPIPLCHL